MMNINNDNYELWLRRYAEQELTDAERAEVEQWLAMHPDAAEEFALYAEAPRLGRDASVHYTASSPRKMLWPIAVRWAAAAAVVAALMVPAMQKVTAPHLESTLVAENKIDIPSDPSPSSLPSQASPTRTAIQASPARMASPTISPKEEEPLFASTEEPVITDTLAPSLPFDTLPVASTIYVDNLIVYVDEPAPVEEYAATDINYVSAKGDGINPVVHFIGTFLKTTR